MNRLSLLCFDTNDVLCVSSASINVDWSVMLRSVSFSCIHLNASGYLSGLELQAQSQTTVCCSSCQLFVPPAPPPTTILSRKYSATQKSGSFHYVHKTPFGSYSFVCVDATLTPGPKRPYNFFGILNQVRLSSTRPRRSINTELAEVQPALVSGLFNAREDFSDSARKTKQSETAAQKVSNQSCKCDCCEGKTWLPAVLSP